MDESKVTPHTDDAERIDGGRVLVLAGVAGSGKSTVGKALADELGWRFIEGDAFHPAANVAKMRRGEPLDDGDRQPWLLRLREEIQRCLDTSVCAVLTCSALKESYRDMLRVDPQRVRFVLLTGSFELLRRRLLERQNHFMASGLLRSQLQTLEPRGDALLVDVDQPVSRLLETIVKHLGHHWLGATGRE